MGIDIASMSVTGFDIQPVFALITLPTRQGR